MAEAEFSKPESTDSSTEFRESCMRFFLKKHMPLLNPLRDGNTMTAILPKI
jgi:hypothetical protein